MTFFFFFFPLFLKHVAPASSSSTATVGRCPDREGGSTILEMLCRKQHVQENDSCRKSRTSNNMTFGSPPAVQPLKLHHGQERHMLHSTAHLASHLCCSCKTRSTDDLCYLPCFFDRHFPDADSHGKMPQENCFSVIFPRCRERANAKIDDRPPTMSSTSTKVAEISPPQTLDAVPIPRLQGDGAGKRLV
jgi:hypothetical protein